MIDHNIAINIITGDLHLFTLIAVVCVHGTA